MRRTTGTKFSLEPHNGLTFTPPVSGAPSHAIRRSFRSFTWPLRSKPKSGNRTASWPGRLACVFVRRRNSALIRSSAFVVRSAFHCALGKLRKVKRSSPASLRQSTTAGHRSSAKSRRRQVSKSSAKPAHQPRDSILRQRPATQQRRQRAFDAPGIRAAQIHAQNRFIDPCTAALIARYQFAPPFGSRAVTRPHARTGHRERRRPETCRHSAFAGSMPIALTSTRLKTLPDWPSPVQFSVQSDSVETSLMNTRLPEMVGCAQVALSATV